MIDPNFVMKQGGMLDEYIRDNARLQKRIAELKDIIRDLNEHEGAEGWSEDLYKRIEIVLSEGCADA